MKKKNSGYDSDYDIDPEMKPLKKKKKKKAKIASEAEVQGSRMDYWKKKGMKIEC